MVFGGPQRLRAQGIKLERRRRPEPHAHRRDSPTASSSSPTGWRTKQSVAGADLILNSTQNGRLGAAARARERVARAVGYGVFAPDDLRGRERRLSIRPPGRASRACSRIGTRTTTPSTPAGATPNPGRSAPRGAGAEQASRRPSVSSAGAGRSAVRRGARGRPAGRFPVALGPSRRRPRRAGRVGARSPARLLRIDWIPAGMRPRRSGDLEVPSVPPWIDRQPPRCA